MRIDLEKPLLNAWNRRIASLAYWHGHASMAARGGPVVAHAEARIRATSYDGPYELSGVAALVGLGKIVELSPRWNASAELSATFGYAEMNPSGSPQLEFSIRNPAVHMQLGIGYRF